MSPDNNASPDGEGVKVAKINASQAIWTALITAVVTVTTTLVATSTGKSDDPTPAPTVTVTTPTTQMTPISIEDLKVSDYLQFEKVAFSPKGDSGRNAYTANARLIQQLPPGMTAWVASRHIETGDPSGSTKLRDAQYGFSSPCAVDSRTKEIDCGTVYLGSDSQTGDFWAWLVVTDSLGTQQLDTQARLGGVFNLRPDFDLRNFAASDPVRESRG